MEQQAKFQVDENFPNKLPYEVTPTKLKGVYLNPAIPDDFDFNQATQDELTKLGLLLPKPTKDSPTHVKRFWKSLSSHKWESKNRIVPQFETILGKSHNHKGTPTKRTDNAILDEQWAGAGNNTGTWTSIVGSWTIPYVGVPPEPQGTEGGWNSSSWAGIDGMFTSDDVLQAGIEQKVDASGHPRYIAWYEWYAPPVPGSPPYIYQTNIHHFHVRPGEKMYCFVRYIDHIAGHIFLWNETTGEYFGITLAPPPGASFNASSCEWIMEAPDGGEPISSLPYFTPVIFTNSFAWGPGAIIVPQGCDTLNVEDPSGQVLTYTTTNSDTLTISFTG
jgi:hypothetical protein